MQVLNVVIEGEITVTEAARLIEVSYRDTR